MDSIKKARILMVDDNPANLLALQAVLKCPEYELIEAASGDEAAQLCEQEEFALIVLDIQMPGRDGYQTALHIKQHGKNRDVPIIFVTATYQDDPHLKRGFEVGAVDFFGKPFDPDILKTKVGIYTELYLKTRQLQETEELLKSHSQIKSLLEAIPLGIVIANAEGEIYELNEEAARIWGNVNDISAAQYQPLARALTGESTEGERVEIETPDGKRTTVTNSAYPIRGSQKQVLGAVLVIQDGTSREAFANHIEQRALALINAGESGPRVSRKH